MGSRDFRIALKTRQEIDYQEPLFAVEHNLEVMYTQAKELAHLFNKRQLALNTEQFLSAAKINASGMLHLLYQAIVSQYLVEQDHDFFTRLTPQITKNHSCQEVLVFFAREFPSPLLNKQQPTAPYLMEETTRGFFVHQVMTENPALLKAIRPLVKPEGVRFPPASVALSALMGGYTKSAPGIGQHDDDLFSFLTAPAKAHPDSLTDQITFILRQWGDLLPPWLRVHLLRAIDYVKEEDKPRFPGGGPGPISVPDYAKKELEYEAYSPDRNWMPNVIMLAKSTLVWLDQLSKSYGYPIETLDRIPDRELDIIAERGFTGLWLIGLWERSPASKRIKNLCGNPEAEASAYSLKGYDIALSIGGWPALADLDRRCKARGVRLASDMVPNHTGLDSDWVLHHPEYFIRTFHAPFPAYSFTGEDLSPDPRVEIKIEDHYFDRTDAAVTFRRVDRQTHETSYIFHGNDGTSMPWNDTAQLDFLNPETREAVIQQILHVARNFHIIRFDAAMTLAKRHIQRLWFPQPGNGGDIPGRAGLGMTDAEFSERMPLEFWREVVDRVATEVPDTLLLAEAFWMMEGFFVRTLGMHRVYNSAFMNMLKNQENQKYRETIKNTLAFDPEILKRFVNFMNNPDEETAIEQFGDGDKYFGICTLLSTMPGLPMFGHGQIEGFREKYGMEYRKAYWNEYPNEHLVGEHYRRIFPLLKMRYAFSGVDNFELFDVTDNNAVADSVFAYVNGTDEKRAMVFYNNRYESAQGRVFHSVPKMTRTPDGNRITRTVSLGESLGLTIGGRRFMLCESFPERLTYIIPSISIFDEGYWVSLSGYETKVLLNIREVEDHDGVYETLYQQLGGNGTDSLERDIAAIRLLPVHKALENFSSHAMMEMMQSIVSSQKTASKGIRKYVLLAGESYARLATLYEGLPRTTLAYLPPLRHEVQPRDLLRQIQNLIECFSSDGPYRMISVGGTIMDELPVLLQLAFLMKIFINGDTDIDEAAQTIGSLMPNRLFAAYRAQFTTDDALFSESLRKAAFLTVLSKEVAKELQKEQPDGKACLERLFGSEEFRRAVGCNSYRQELWYRKEWFQESVFLLALGTCMQECAHKEAVHQLLASWLRADLASEYKVRKLIEHVN